MGRHRKHANNAQRQKAYRLRQSQLQTLLAVPNPAPDSLAGRVQAAYYRQKVQNDPTTKKFLEDLRQACADRAAKIAARK